MDCDDPDLQYFLNDPDLPKLSESSKLDCEENISYNGLKEALLTFNKNKSPGLDGLTMEFYSHFWPLLQSKLIAMYEESFFNLHLPKAVVSGLITLLEKKDKDRAQIENWRPITLLNFDYKLLSKFLTLRLKKVVPTLVHPDQNGFVPGGNIFFSLQTIRDLLFYCEKENLELILLAIDYTKAFDSLDFNFVHKMMENYGFGEYFRTWIKIIYTGGQSCVKNNGFLSDFFPINRSARQGDPI